MSSSRGIFRVNSSDDDDVSTNTAPSLRPKAAPPASAPPPPPPGTPASVVHIPSYQQQQQQQQYYDNERYPLMGGGSLVDKTPSPQHLPSITHYDYEQPNPNTVVYYGSSVSSWIASSFRMGGAVSGDVNMRPNTGLTNSSTEASMFGLAFDPFLKRIRAAITMLSTVVIVYLFFTWYMRIFRLDKLVMTGYLAFMAGLLFIGEVFIVIRPETTNYNNNNRSKLDNSNLTTEALGAVVGNTGLESMAKTATTDRARDKIGRMTGMHGCIRNNFGLMLHPLGKAALLMFTGTLCFGVGSSIIDLVLGCAYIVLSMVLIGAYIRYPQFRRPPYTPEDDEDDEVQDETIDFSGAAGLAAAAAATNNFAAADRAAHAWTRTSDSADQSFYSKPFSSFFGVPFSEMERMRMEHSSKGGRNGGRPSWAASESTPLSS